MAGTVITVSPQVPVDQLKRLVRARVERDGGVELAVTADDGRQVAHLGRLAKRLRADERLACFPFTDTGDGGTYLTVVDADQQVTGWAWQGDAKIG